MAKIVVICVLAWAIGSGLSGRNGNTTTTTANVRGGTAASQGRPAATRICGRSLCTVTTGSVGVRTAPRPGATRRYTVARGGTVYLGCWVRGPAVGGDPIWYRARRPGGTTGWVPGFSVATGRDPHARVKAC